MHFFKDDRSYHLYRSVFDHLDLMVKDRAFVVAYPLILNGFDLRQPFLQGDAFRHRKCIIPLAPHCDYSWHGTTPGPQRSWTESRRLLLARDYSWPVTPDMMFCRRSVIGRFKESWSVIGLEVVTSWAISCDVIFIRPFCHRSDWTTEL